MAAPDGELDLGLRRFVLPLLFVVGLFVAVWLRRPDGPPPEPVAVEHFVELGGPIFGTSWSAKVVPGDQPTDEAQSAIEAALQRVDAQMSTWRDDSELSRLNRHGSEPFPASDGLRTVIAEAVRLHAVTGGAFDVTVDPLVKAWGFGPSDTVEPPSADELAAARANVDGDGLQVDGGAIVKSAPSLTADLSAIAKGWAVDEAARALEALGLERYLVEVGGEVRARGTNARGVPWRVGVETPDGGVQDVFETVSLDGIAMATSGNYRQLRTVDGRTVTHIIDPRRGEPVDHGLGSVSVIAPTCIEADGLATALYVLGADEGRRLADQQGWAALFLTASADGVQREASAAWPAQ